MKKELPHNSFVFSIKTNQGNSCYKSFTNLKPVYSTEKEAKEVSEAEKTHQESLSKQIAELQCIGKIVSREFVLIFKNYASIAAVHKRRDLPNGTIVGLEVDAGVQLFRLTQAKITPY